MGQLIYGLDFGTTNSSITLSNGKKTIILPIGIDGGKTMRSVIYFPPLGHNYWIGDEAIEEYIEAGMRGYFIQSMKTALPEIGYSGTTINHKKYTPDSLISLIIGEVKSRADEMIDRKVNTVILGRPALFSEEEKEEKLAEERLISAAKLAGFENIYLQLEPIAAAFSYEASLSSPELVLVADFGGGTSDFSLMNLDPKKRGLKDRKSDVIGTAGVRSGGDVLDSEIMWKKLVKYFGSEIKYDAGHGTWINMPSHIMYALREWYMIPFIYRNRKMREFIERLECLADDPEPVKRLKALIGKNLGFSLFQSIEKAKWNLSEKEEAEIIFNESIISIHESIARLEFEEMIAKYLDSFSSCVDKLLVSTGINFSDVDTVFLTGGTSLLPAIYNLFKTKFGETKIKKGDTFLSVTEGLARSFYLLED